MNWSGLATTAGAIQYILDVGTHEMARYRDVMLARLQSELPRAGWQPFTPPDHQGPSVVFGKKDVRARFREPLKKARISASLYSDRIRISPSVHNSMADIDKLLTVLTARS